MDGERGEVGRHYYKPQGSLEIIERSDCWMYQEISFPSYCKLLFYFVSFIFHFPCLFYIDTVDIGYDNYAFSFEIYLPQTFLII